MAERVDAIGLISGGLDSILALHLMLEQGLAVEALHAVLPVHGPEQRLWVEQLTAELGVPLHLVPLEEEFYALLREPRHGYGSGMNPCLDCRIQVLRCAGERMRELGAAFVFTGEVVGERPMSQNLRAMGLVERRSGLVGRLLRPLSARLLPPTLPEEEGLVDRDRLLAIQGRSRRPQLALAERVGLTEYPSPAGGCLLTDPAFARRARDLLAHQPDFAGNDFQLLRVGRHFRLSPSVKVVCGRDQGENERIVELARESDLLFEVRGCGSPVTLLRGGADDESVRLAAAITVRYSDADRGLRTVVFYDRAPAYPELGRQRAAAPAPAELLDRLRI